jgi:hypothetical protein
MKRALVLSLQGKVIHEFETKGFIKPARFFYELAHSYSILPTNLYYPSQTQLPQHIFRPRFTLAGEKGKTKLT